MPHPRTERVKNVMLVVEKSLHFIIIIIVKVHEPRLSNLSHALLLHLY